MQKKLAEEKIGQDVRDYLCERWKVRFEENIKRRFNNPETWTLFDKLEQYFLRYLIYKLSNFNPEDIDALNGKRSKFA